jgi:hypothetical protein
MSRFGRASFANLEAYRACEKLGRKSWIRNFGYRKSFGNERCIKFGQNGRYTALPSEANLTSARRMAADEAAVPPSTCLPYIALQ